MNERLPKSRDRRGAPRPTWSRSPTAALEGDARGGGGAGRGLARAAGRPRAPARRPDRAQPRSTSAARRSRLKERDQRRALGAVPGAPRRFQARIFAPSRAPPRRRSWSSTLVLPSGGGRPDDRPRPRKLERAARDRARARGPTRPTRSCCRRARRASPIPNLEGEFGWRSAGQRDRRDRGPGRDHRLLRARRASASATRSSRATGSRRPRTPARPRSTTSTFSSFADGGQEIVTWWREGTTCVMSGKGVSRRGAGGPRVLEGRGGGGLLIFVMVRGSCASWIRRRPEGTSRPCSAPPARCRDRGRWPRTWSRRPT